MLRKNERVTTEPAEGLEFIPDSRLILQMHSVIGLQIFSPSKLVVREKKISSALNLFLRLKTLNLGNKKKKSYPFALLCPSIVSTGCGVSRIKSLRTFFKLNTTESLTCNINRL